MDFTDSSQLVSAVGAFLGVAFYFVSPFLCGIMTDTPFRILWVLFLYHHLYVEGNIKDNFIYICMVWPVSWGLVIVLSVPTLIYLFTKTKRKIQAFSDTVTV